MLKLWISVNVGYSLPLVITLKRTVTAVNGNSNPTTSLIFIHSSHIIPSILQLWIYISSNNIVLISNCWCSSSQSWELPFIQIYRLNKINVISIQVCYNGNWCNINLDLTWIIISCTKKLENLLFYKTVCFCVEFILVETWKGQSDKRSP
jgi:hypothetical protein